MNISAAYATGSDAKTQAAKNVDWLRENRPQIDAYNEWVEKEGLPLASYRTF